MSPGIYLMRKGRQFPVGVLHQYASNSHAKGPGGKTSVVVPVYPGGDLFSAIYVINRNVDDGRGGPNDYAERFYCELAAKRLAMDKRDDVRKLELNGVSVRTQNMCIIDRRWRSGNSIEAALALMPRVHNVTVYIWESHDIDKENKVLAHIMGFNDHALRSFVDKDVTVRTIHSDVEMKFVQIEIGAETVPEDVSETLNQLPDGFCSARCEGEGGLLRYIVGSIASNRLGYPREPGEWFAFEGKVSQATPFTEGKKTAVQNCNFSEAASQWLQTYTRQHECGYCVGRAIHGVFVKYNINKYSLIFISVTDRGNTYNEKYYFTL